MFKLAPFISAPSDSLDMQTLGAAVSMIAYVLVIMIFLICLRRLLAAEPLCSKRTRLFLLVYITLMFFLATLALVQEFLYFSETIFPSSGSSDPINSHSSSLSKIFDVPITLPFAIWGADAFMIWRCAMLYQGISPAPRAGILCLLSTLLLLSLGGGICVFVQPIFVVINGIVFLIILTTFVNVVLAVLIVFRLVHHEKYLRKSLGVVQGSPYTRVMVMCSESCALVIVASLLFVGLYYRSASNAFLIPLLLLPYICVISPLLIIYRVAQGRAVTTLRPSQIITPDIEGLILASSRFDGVEGAGVASQNNDSRTGAPIVTSPPPALLSNRASQSIQPHA
ncbi:hypothetical protein BDZ97DRAFT_780654 [Flammula alnicola]|nr:hypothetical protein BDZ97DRAFT_780654 [Flammula alnicola]